MAVAGAIAYLKTPGFGTAIKLQWNPFLCYSGCDGRSAPLAQDAAGRHVDVGTW